MMKTVKHTIHVIGDHGSDLASETVDLARRFGSGTVDLARQIGPRRGLIGLVVVAAAIGGSIVLVRYLRARKADSEREITADDMSNGLGGRRRGKYSPASSNLAGTH